MNRRFLTLLSVLVVAVHLSAFTLPYTNSFTGAIGDPLSGSWVFDVGSFVINGANQSTGNTLAQNMGRYTGDTMPDDQYVQGNAYPDPGQASGFLLRASSTGGGQGYALYLYDPGSGPSLYLQEITGGGSSFFLLGGPISATRGDLLYGEIVGTNITIKLNGTTVITQSSSTFTTGQTGLYAYLAAAADNFETGAIGGGGGPGPGLLQLLTLGVGGNMQ